MNTNSIFALLKHFLFSMIVAFGCYALSGCAGSSDTADTGGTETQITSVTEFIDETGGVLEVSGSGSPADGSRVIISPGALTEEREISISHGETNLDIPLDVTAAGGQIDFGPDGIQFEEMVHISVPYLDSDSNGVVDGTEEYEYNVELMYYSENSGSWEFVEILNRNAANNIVEAETNHFSTYLVVVDNEGGSNTGGDTTGFWPGEYFVGTPDFRIIDPDIDVNAAGNKELIKIGCIEQDLDECSQDNSCVGCGKHYVLTITAENGLKAVVDRHATYVGGYPASIDENGAGVTVDVSEIFDKIDRSGDAGLWDWRCEFISEHTHLKNFEVCDDNYTNAICSGANETFYCSIDVISQTQIRFNLGIDISDATDNSGTIIPNSNFSTGDMLAIRFEANYR